MDEKLYISPNLFFQKNKLYYDHDKPIKINAKNWCKYLEEYGWTKLPLGWRKRLKTEDKNFRFGILDCGSEGDCLFHCVAEALYDENNLDIEKYTVEELRKLTSSMVTKDNFVLILENYKCEEQSGIFNGYWEPNKIKEIEQLRKEINICGDNFWGDHLLLQLLQEKLKFNIIILNSGVSYDGSKKDYTIHPTASDINTYDKTIVLYYEDGLHFQLVGYFQKDRMIKKFTREDIPTQLLEIYNKDTNNF